MGSTNIFKSCERFKDDDFYEKVISISLHRLPLNLSNELFQKSLLRLVFAIITIFGNL